MHQHEILSTSHTYAIDDYWKTTYRYNHVQQMNKIGYIRILIAKYKWMQNIVSYSKIYPEGAKTAVKLRDDMIPDTYGDYKNLHG